ncbi:hypothetical protein H4219_006181 [Mycoemilia scoparia]|uniref:Uncharacterized protein n=1 Tax=Mycoemilia scoparia TaxID=417184 RepID=A0A9W7ZSL3_9FUNG|nr:hypothetical protein H4219_006181 [Mycoemilia scoparia]
MSMPAAIRKKSEIYNQNIHKRGKVKKSLTKNIPTNADADADAVDVKSEAPKKKGPPENQRVYIILLILLLGSLVFPLIAPLLF